MGTNHVPFAAFEGSVGGAVDVVVTCESFVIGVAAVEASVDVVVSFDLLVAAAVVLEPFAGFVGVFEALEGVFLSSASDRVVNDSANADRRNSCIGAILEHGAQRRSR